VFAAGADNVVAAAAVDRAVGAEAQAYDEELKSRLKGLAFIAHVDPRWTADQTGVFVRLCSRTKRKHGQGLNIEDLLEVR